MPTEAKMGPGWKKWLEELLRPLALALLIVSAFYWSGRGGTSTERPQNAHLSGPNSSLRDLHRTLLQDVTPRSLGPPKLEERVEAFLLAPHSAQSKLSAFIDALANSGTQVNTTHAVQAKAIVDGIRERGQHLPCRWGISRACSMLLFRLVCLPMCSVLWRAFLPHASPIPCSRTAGPTPQGCRCCPSAITS